MMVRFATTCDHPDCGQRSEEYTSWPSCRYCGDSCCPAHRQVKLLVEADVDQPEVCLCHSPVCIYDWLGGGGADADDFTEAS